MGFNLFRKKCSFCNQEYDVDTFEECLECGSQVCPACLDTDSHGSPVCPACYEDDDNYGRTTFL